MSDGKKSCLGFAFLILALGLAALALVSGGVGELIQRLGGGTAWVDLKTGAFIAIGVFALFAILAAVMFLSVRDWAWFPAIIGGVYTILPDLIIGPEDDALALVLGVVVSGLLAWRNQQKEQKALGSGE